jgi:prevent-host-death family protein
MAEIDLSQLERAPSDAIERAEAGERLVVTRNGEPAAVIMSAEDAEDFALANADEYVALRSEGRAAYERAETLPLPEHD